MNEPRPGSQIGWFTAACLLVSNVIGGGIFTVTGYLARDLGDPLIILGLWIVGALIALAGAFSYSELGASLPQAGGDYVYLRQAYGPLVGFLSGWISFTVGFGAAIAASSVSFSAYAARAIPGLTEGDVSPVIPALALVWMLTAVHVQGVSTGGWVQRLLTTTKVAALLAIILGGFLFGTGDWGHLSVRADHVHPSFSLSTVALIFVFYTYLGWNVVGYVAAELVDPPRALPKIIVRGTLFVAVLYLLINLVYVFALPVTILGEPPLLPVAEKAAAALWGPQSARFFALLLCISITGGVSAMIWAGPRIYWAMAKDGMFLSFFSHIDSRTGAPTRVIILQSLWASLLIITGTFEQLVVFGGSVLALFTALTVGAVFILRRRYPDLTRPYRVPWYPVIPLAFILAMLVMVTTIAVTRPTEALMGAVTILAGAIAYRMFSKKGRSAPPLSSPGGSNP
ncbi:MAG: APC family permease [Nitrospiraceae bacterium]